MNVQYKADTPGPGVVSAAFSLSCSIQFQELYGLFFDMKINFWTFVLEGNLEQHIKGHGDTHLEWKIGVEDN